MPAQAVRMPRIDGSQISPTYVIIGASISPTPRPSSTVATKTSVNDCALYIMIQAIMWGTLTMNMAFLRPSGSDSQPEKRLPTGWQMYAMLPSHDDCDGVKCRNSSALLILSWPVKAGMTMVANDTANPRSNNRKFLAVLAKIYGYWIKAWIKLIRYLIALSFGLPVAISSGTGSPCPFLHCALVAAFRQPIPLSCDEKHEHRIRILEPVFHNCIRSSFFFFFSCISFIWLMIEWVIRRLSLASR